jgi:hypothetical protein
MVLGTYANNIYLLMRLDYFSSLSHTITTRLPLLLFLLYTSTPHLPQSSSEAT